MLPFKYCSDCKNVKRTARDCCPDCGSALRSSVYTCTAGIGWGIAALVAAVLIILIVRSFVG